MNREAYTPTYPDLPNQPVNDSHCTPPSPLPVEWVSEWRWFHSKFPKNLNIYNRE